MIGHLGSTEAGVAEPLMGVSALQPRDGSFNMRGDDAMLEPVSKSQS